MTDLIKRKILSRDNKEKWNKPWSHYGKKERIAYDIWDILVSEKLTDYVVLLKYQLDEDLKFL